MRVYALLWCPLLCVILETFALQDDQWPNVSTENGFHPWRNNDRTEMLEKHKVFTIKMQPKPRKKVDHSRAGFWHKRKAPEHPRSWDKHMYNQRKTGK